MNNFLKKLSLFSVFGIIGYCIILSIWSYIVPFEALKKNMNYKIGSYGHMYSRMQELKIVENIDILVIGSSHAYRGFDPRIFEESGIRIFNLGSSNQTPLQALSLLNSYLDQLNPQLVIYEVYPGIFQNDGVESSLDIIANTELSWGTLEMTTRVNHLKSYNALIYDVFSEFFGMYSEFKEPAEKGDDRYIAGGYVEKNESYTRQQNRRVSSEWVLVEEQFFYLKDIAELIRKKGKSFLMVQSPVDIEYFKSFRNRDLIDHRFNTVGDHINFNSFLSFNYPKDLYDLHHLRQSGVKQFNRELIKLIQKEGYLD